MMSFCLFIVLILSEASAFIVHQQLKFVDCLADKSNEYALIDHVSLNPDPVILPGDLTVGANININTNITSHGLSMNVTIYKVLLGRRTKVPCLSNVGSCTYDLCDLIGYATNGSSSDCDTPELVGTGLPCKCPIKAGIYRFAPHLFNVPKIDGVWSWLASGDYHVHVEFTDTTMGRSVKVACYDIDVALTNKKTPGFIFG